VKHILIMEGDTLARQKQSRKLGVSSSSDIYLKAIRTHFPDLDLDVIHAADRGQAPPKRRKLQDYDGLIVSGSGLHCYDQDFAVTNQIEMVKTYACTGKPILGSCWGLQIATIAAGGTVGLNPKGLEVCIARKVRLTKAGQSHPFLAGREDIYDAPCLHYDEVTKLPGDAVILCSNHHSSIQGAIVPVERSAVWGVQYHPEFDLNYLATLIKLYSSAMVEQGFFNNDGENLDYQAKLKRLSENPDNKALAWQLGIDCDILDDRIRNREIINWINSQILI